MEHMIYMVFNGHTQEYYGACRCPCDEEQRWTRFITGAKIFYTKAMAKSVARKYQAEALGYKLSYMEQFLCM